MRTALAVLALAAAVAAPAAPRPPRAPAPATLDSVVGAQPARWGVSVARLDTGEPVYEHNGDALMQPASNEKAFTTAAVLDALGPEWTTKTSVYAAAKPDSNGVVAGDLVLYGRGDPNLSGRFSDGDALAPLRRLAAALRDRGVRRVEGGLVADESYLSGPPHGSGWAWEDLQWHFGAEVSALSFSDNLATVHVAPGASPNDPCVVTLDPDVGYLEVDNQSVTVAGRGASIAVHGSLDAPLVVVGGSAGTGYAGWTGEVSVSGPALYTAAAFRRALADVGIEIAGPTRRLDAYMVRPLELELDRLVELASIDSLPLADMVRVVNKHSQNLHAELLLRMLGREKGPEGLASDEAGVVMVTAFLQRIGAFQPGARIFDGCGLSRLDRVSPRMFVALMRAMDRSPAGGAFLDSLPVAGVDGTLRHRLGGVPVRAKTGSLETAKSLSGYVTTPSGQRLAFSILYNAAGGTAGAIGQIDRIAALLAAGTPP